MTAKVSSATSRSTDTDLEALVLAGMEDGCTFGALIKLLRDEDPTLSLRSAADFLRVLLTRLGDKGSAAANQMLLSAKGIV